MFGVLIPVGPSERDLVRLGWLVSELAAHEDPREIRLIVVDDAPAARDLQVGWPELERLRTGLWSAHRPPPAPLSAHVAGTLAGLSRARDLEFVLKLDTDAAVIAPFSPALRSAFGDDAIGVVGSYNTTSHGGRRDWSPWARPLARATAPLYLDRTRRIFLGYRPAAARRVVRAVRRSASGAAPVGAHCLGAAYAVSRSFLRTTAMEPDAWIHSGLGEDVVVGLLASAAGLRMSSLTSPGDPFALSWRGLPAPPEELRAGGYSIVHSVKAETLDDERALRSALAGDGA